MNPVCLCEKCPNNNTETNAEQVKCNAAHGFSLFGKKYHRSRVANQDAAQHDVTYYPARRTNEMSVSMATENNSNHDCSEDS